MAQIQFGHQAYYFFGVCKCVCVCVCVCENVGEVVCECVCVCAIEWVNV